ncbi:GAF domain-containing protein [Aurantimonas sp. HBX-1]|uniref:GAF domain-containing protein n=1 Tax=Aurantimonas sp. HBX-1 TaxID=2906072 RepID=UPI001F475D31|nr:GAF domain-containing protein [Aurantimonas sp. HBX-1]UIJ72581.1 excisionase family DNA-binding protein [Aurantimonas sp. HBX-1]
MLRRVALYLRDAASIHGRERQSINSIISINSPRSYRRCFAFQLKHGVRIRRVRSASLPFSVAIPMTNKDILTTAETARLFGVSVRTAQLLIEGGSIPSWKTPGGHRRVYRADVEALIEGPAAAVAPPSAMVVIIAAADRLTVYDRLFSGISEFAVEGFADPFAALLAIGSMRPFAIVVDLHDCDPSRRALLPSLLHDPALGRSRILTVAAPPPASEGGARVSHVGTPEAAAAELRKALADADGRETLPTEGIFPLSLNERQRLVALERSGLVDTVPEEAFDRLTWLAAQTLDAPVALLTLLTQTRQWFKSRIGLDFPETPRSWSFCNHTILQNGIFAVADLASDARFAANPAVVGPPGFRFYAGVPVRDGDGFAVGSLCVIDYEPRVLGETEEKALLALAGLASDELRLRSAERALHQARRRGERDAPPVGSRGGRRSARPTVRHPGARGRGPAAD